MPIEITNITRAQLVELLARGEDHFLDFKSMKLSPTKATKILSAFANSDGGELFFGIEDNAPDPFARWQGFSNPEAANGHIQDLEQFLPAGHLFQV